jgi:hypothetical protein
LYYIILRISVGNFDNFFIFNGTNTTGHVWKGYFRSILLNTGEKWRLQSIKDPNQYLETEASLPIGRLQ